MKTLLLDIETAPNKAYVWGLFDQNIAINQLEASSYILCWSAKWVSGQEITFRKSQPRRRERVILMEMRRLLDEADVVVHYNGLKFDIPTLQKEFLRLHIPPPAPFKQVDLMRVVKRVFRFESNKLAYVATALGLPAKVQNEGFQMWVRCMEGDPEAWKKMEAYNRGDVVLLETLYQRLMPWIEKHPNHSAFADAQCCPKCGSVRFQRRGTAVCSTLRYARYQCQRCGGWFRGTKTVSERGTSSRMTNILN